MIMMAVACPCGDDVIVLEDCRTVQLQYAEFGKSNLFARLGTAEPLFLTICLLLLVCWSTASEPSHTKHDPQIYITNNWASPLV